jgi:autotransporter-associated beta strand protein
MSSISRRQVAGLIALAAMGSGVIPAGAAVTNIWKIGGTDTNWTTVNNWTLGHKPLATEVARMGDAGPTGFIILTNALDTTETVDGVLVDPSNRSYNWLGAGTLNVNNDFNIKGWTMTHNYIQPTLNVNGRFIVDFVADLRGSFKLGTPTGYTSGNIFGGGVYNYGRAVYFGGTTTFSNTLLVQSARLLGFVYAASSRAGITYITNSSSLFGPGMTFDVRPGGVLWFPQSNNFENVGTLAFNGGMLRLDASSGYVFPTYANGIEVKRGMLGIAGNGSMGSDANGLRLGGTNSFGWLVGVAANTAGNYITRPITLNGNGGVVWVSQYYNNADMNFATEITGPGMLIKTGEKALYLRNVGVVGANSYAGGTVVAGGDLWPESNRTLGTGNVALASGGWLHLANAAQVGAGTKVFVGGSVYNPGVLHLLSDQVFPTIDTNSTGEIALEVANTHALTAVGSAFLGSANNGSTYSAASLPVGAGNTYRIGYTYSLNGGGGWQQMLSLDVGAGGNGGTGVLTGDNDLLVAYGGCWLRDINTFTGATTVRNNLLFNGWSCPWLQPVFMSGGSPFGSPSGAVNLYNGGIYFDNQYSVNPGAITKGALNIQGQNVVCIGTPAGVTSTVTFASINRNQRGQLSVGSTSSAWIGGLARLVVTAAPTPSNGMVDPWLMYAWNGAGTFLNYGGLGYTQANYHVTVSAGNFPSLSGGTNVVVVSGTATLVDNPDLYALRADAAVNGPTFTNTLRSGGLIFNNALTHTANFKFGAAGDAEAIVYVNSGTTLSGTLTTTAGLTKGGPGTLTLTGVNTNTLLGDIIINGGSLKVSSDANLCAAANKICINGGSFDPSNQSIYRSLSIGSVGGYLCSGSYFGSIVDEVPGTAGGPLVVVANNLAQFKTVNTFTCPLIIVGGVRVDFAGTPGRGPVTIKAGSAMTLFGYGGIDSTGRYSLQAGNGYTSLIFDNDGGPATARMYRLGSVEGSGNISFGAGYQKPPANSALIVGNDNTSCDYYGRIMQYDPDSMGYVVIKEGTGTWTLWGDSMWIGPLIASNGTLQVNGAIDRVTSVAVRNGATLSGKGLINAPVTVEAGCTLGGSLMFGSSVTLAATCTNAVALNGTTPVTGYGQMTMQAAPNLNGSVLNLTLGYVPAVGQSFTILNNTSASLVTGKYACGDSITATFGGRTYFFRIDYNVGEGNNDVVLTRLVTGTVMTIR